MAGLIFLIIKLSSMFFMKIIIRLILYIVIISFY
ncbi:Uncharacterised protein [Yersinia thracica]|uniref:Uncharacterized protein n=1 Tax=Yersinia thracica TaxID=2890319 RepID=A0A0T9P3B8_9GAMM|nr:Uncharacterised protein [Yersinia thracica]